MRARSDFKHIAYRDEGTAGAVCRDLLTQYKDSMELVWNHRELRTKTAETRTKEQRFSDIHTALKKYRSEIFMVRDPNNNLLSGMEQLPLFEEVFAADNPLLRDTDNCLIVIFKDSTALQFGVRHGITFHKIKSLEIEIKNVAQQENCALPVIAR